MTFDRGWDFDHGNTPITLNKISQDEETIAAITALMGEASGVLGDLSDDTVDTEAEYRLIMFSNGNVRAVPVATPDPVAPLNLDGTPGLSSVRLTWDAPLTGSVGSYAIWRDGVQIGTNSARNYRDTGVVVGNTYEYTVQTIDPYGQRSDQSDPFEAFIDPALNVAPTVTVTSWPPAAPSNGRTYVRVCASDANAQTLTLALECDEGTLVATDDPSIWLYTPPEGP
jgi:hypothetical protein